jgi:Kef-type K+ transport system membrane component KefB
MRRYVASQAPHLLSSLLVPLFFVLMGLQVDLGSLGNLSTTLSRARQHDLSSTIHICMLSSQYQDGVQERQ